MELLPANWSSTENSLEGLAFLAKDCVLVVDDFKPGGMAQDQVGGSHHGKADRLLRAQGNRSGRGRMRVDGTLRPEKPPRGLIISTGEDVPRGASLQARMVLVDVAKDRVNWSKVTECQRDAESGRYAAAMAGFLGWLASDYEKHRRLVKDRAAELRAKRPLQADHGRTVDNAASLLAGFNAFLEFAKKYEAITREEADALYKRGVKALKAVAARQEQRHREQDPVNRYLELLRAAFACRKARLEGIAQQMPTDAERWGWSNRYEEFANGGHEMIGWVEGEDVYLIPQAAYAVVQRQATAQGDPFTLTQGMTNELLKQRKVLAYCEPRRCTIRKRIKSEYRTVLWINSSTFYPKESEEDAKLAA